MKALTESLKHSFLRRFLAGSGGCLLVLLLQNIIIFWHHYVGTTCFLNDFTRNIYPMIAFWTTLVHHGVFPEWTPFQAMGMPFVLTMQSGIFYPPLWIFTLFDAPFTLHMAAIVQILHVLWGALGCWMYMRLLGRSRGAALFAAIAFQFFGGFYSNAEHIDIIRAFSYIPWLFWAIHLTPAQQRLAGRNWLTPLMMMFFITSTYQGNLVSHLFILGFFWLLSWLSNHFQRQSDWRLVAKLHMQLAGLVVLGVAISSVYFFPTLALKSYLAREGIWAGKTMNWPLGYWNTLIMASDAEGIYIYPTMASAFITVPAFCFLFFIQRDAIKQNRVWVAVILLAGVMASGTHSMFYRWIINLVPPLGYSRFPSSDYRGILCFGLILLASYLLDEYLHARATKKITRHFIVCVGLLVFFYLVKLLVMWLSSTDGATWVAAIQQHKKLAMVFLTTLAFLSEHILSAENTEWLMAISLVVLVFLTLYLTAKYRVSQQAVLAALIFLQLVSGFYFVKQESVYWSTDVATNDFHQSIARESAYTVLDIIDHPPQLRPACTDMNLWAGSWRGYLLGDYMCQTQDSKTQPREIVNANPVIKEYMRQPWQARLLQKEQLVDCQPEAVLHQSMSSAPITSTSYGLHDITYQVNAVDDFCFVENELLFPGWLGTVSTTSAHIQPQAYCGALRSWCLPKGNYEFAAHYRSPGLRAGAIASMLFFLLYIVLVVRWFILNKETDAIS